MAAYVPDLFSFKLRRNKTEDQRTPGVSAGESKSSESSNSLEANSAAKKAISGLPTFYAFCASHTQSRFQQDTVRFSEELIKSNYSVVSKPGATKAEVVAGANDLVKRACEKDVVVFYISTHGADPEDYEGKLMLAFSDGLLDSDDFMKPLAKLKTKKVLILLHSCFAAAAVRHNTPANQQQNTSSPNNKSSSSTQAVLEELSRKTGKATFCAGPPDLVTYGQYFPNAVLKTYKKFRESGEMLKLFRFFADVSEDVEKELGDSQYCVLNLRDCNDFPLLSPVAPPPVCFYFNFCFFFLPT